MKYAKIFFLNVFNNQSRTTTSFSFLGSFVDFIIATFLKKYFISPNFIDLLPLFFHLFSFSFLDCFFLAPFLRHQYCRKQTIPSLNYLWFLVQMINHFSISFKQLSVEQSCRHFHFHCTRDLKTTLSNRRTAIVS